MANVPRSVEFQYGATMETLGDEQHAVVTDHWYGDEYVYPGPLSGPIPPGVDPRMVGKAPIPAPTKS